MKDFTGLYRSSQQFLLFSSTLSLKFPLYNSSSNSFCLPLCKSKHFPIFTYQSICTFIFLWENFCTRMNAVLGPFIFQILNIYQLNIVIWRFVPFNTLNSYVFYIYVVFLNYYDFQTLSFRDRLDRDVHKKKGIMFSYKLYY